MYQEKLKHTSMEDEGYDSYNSLSSGHSFDTDTSSRNPYSTSMEKETKSYDRNHTGSGLGSSLTGNLYTKKYCQNHSSLDSQGESINTDSHDSGVGDSLKSLPSLGSQGRSSFSDKPLTADVAKPTETVSANPYLGSPEDFLLELKSDWTNWVPGPDIKDRLSTQHLDSLRTIFWVQDEEKDFEALEAALDGDEPAVALAVFITRDHKQLNTMNKYRQTILHIASEKCSAKLVRLIITRGADGAIADVWGDTPLHIAARLGRADVIKALTMTLTKPEVRHPYYRVPYKSLPQDNVQSYNHDGRAPVHLASQKAHSGKHRDALCALAKYAKADMDYRRLGDGYSPSHIAIDNDDYECLKTCLVLGADSEVRNFKSETPQQLAYLCGSTKMVKLCQQYGASERQLEYAETESVPFDEDMDCDEGDEECVGASAGLSHKMELMAV